LKVWEYQVAICKPDPGSAPGSDKGVPSMSRWQKPLMLLPILALAVAAALMGVLDSPVPDGWIWDEW
jgi:hypothetical protein